MWKSCDYLKIDAKLVISGASASSIRTPIAPSATLFSVCNCKHPATVRCTVIWLFYGEFVVSLTSVLRIPGYSHKIDHSSATLICRDYELFLDGAKAACGWFSPDSQRPRLGTPTIPPAFCCFQREGQPTWLKGPGYRAISSLLIRIVASIS